MIWTRVCLVCGAGPLKSNNGKFCPEHRQVAYREADRLRKIRWRDRKRSNGIDPDSTTNPPYDHETERRRAIVQVYHPDECEECGGLVQFISDEWVCSDCGLVYD